MDNLHTILQKIRRLARWLRPMQIPLHSARTSFFLILSLFPSLLLLLGLLRFTNYGVEELLNLAEGLLPHSLMGIVEALVETSYRHSSGVVVSVSALAALWSASKGTYGLLCGLNAVYGVKEQRGYWRSRSISVVYTFGFLLVLVLTLVLHVFGTTLLDYLWMTTVPALMAVMSLVDLRLVLLLVLQTILFTILYALLPSRRNRLRSSIPGALMASICWSVCSALFSVYVQFFTRYTNIYGSIYALALGMLWLYFCINILFYGGAFNRFLEERKY
jgi:membrane protein